MIAVKVSVGKMVEKGYEISTSRYCIRSEKLKSPATPSPSNNNRMIKNLILVKPRIIQAKYLMNIPCERKYCARIKHPTTTPKYMIIGATVIGSNIDNATTTVTSRSEFVCSVAVSLFSFFIRFFIIFFWFNFHKVLCHSCDPLCNRFIDCQFEILGI